MLEILGWVQSMIELHRKPGVVSFMDKIEAFYGVCRAYTQLKLSRSEEERASLRQAKETAIRFDVTPDYAPERLCFTVPGDVTVHDNYASTAMKGVEGSVREFDDPALTELWVAMWVE